MNCDWWDYWIPLILGVVPTACLGVRGCVPGDFAHASIVEDLGGPEAVVAVGVGVVAPGDFAEVVEDAVYSAGGFLELLGGVTGEDGVDGACLSIRLHER